MDYTKYLKEAREAADQIQAGLLKEPDTDKKKSFLEPKKQKEDNSTDDFGYIVAKYIAGLRQQGNDTVDVTEQLKGKKTDD